MDNNTVILGLLDSVLTGRVKVLSNEALTLTRLGDMLQLLADGEGLVATANLKAHHRSVLVRCQSPYWPSIHTTLLSAHWLPVRTALVPGFYQYEWVQVPPNYQVHFTDSLDLMQVWHSYRKPGKSHTLIDLLVFNRASWYPIRDMSWEQGTLNLQTLGTSITLYPCDRLVWLQRQEQPLQPQDLQRLPPGESSMTSMSAGERDGQNLQDSWPQLIELKQLGEYLVEAGLLSLAQVDVALMDQELTGMRLGEILVKRGWIKQKTIEFIMEQVILPQRAAAREGLEGAKLELDQRLEQDLTSVPVPQLSQIPPSLPETQRPPSPSQPPAIPSVNERETLVIYESEAL